MPWSELTYCLVEENMPRSFVQSTICPNAISFGFKQELLRAITTGKAWNHWLVTGAFHMITSHLLSFASALEHQSQNLQSISRESRTALAELSYSLKLD